MYELITERERCIIDDYRYDYARGNNEMCTIEHLLRFWKEAKSKYLFDIFGGKLILEKEIEIEVSYGEIYNQMIKLQQHPWARKLWYQTHTHIRTDDLAKNKLEYDWEVYDNTSSNLPRHIFQQGMKTMRALAQLNEMLNLDEPLTEKVSMFEDFRQKHSQILNQKKQKGTLCLSIHPLDYITMSMNECGWQSCMRWDEGDYRMGTVEMMNSDCVVVAYLKSQNNMSNGWNNKKWRELFIIDHRVLIGVKGYPYCDKNLEKIVFDWIVELIQKNGTLEWRGIEYAPIFDWNCGLYVPIKVPGVNGEISEICLNSGAMYNDFYELRSVRLAAHAGDLGSYIEIPYSGTAECMWCGERMQCDEDYANELTCCTPHCYCECCDEHIPHGDIYYGPNDEPLCYSCYCETVSNCSSCGEDYYEDENGSVQVGGFYFENEQAAYAQEYVVPCLCPACTRGIKHFVRIHYPPHDGAYWQDTGDFVNADKVPDDVFESILGMTKDYVKDNCRPIKKFEICF